MHPDRETLKKILTILFILAVFFFLSRNICQNWEQISKHKWNFNYLSLTASFLFLSCGLFLTAGAWVLILNKVNGNLGLKKGLRIWFCSSLARYVPGKVWIVLGRAYLCEKEGLSKSGVFISIVLEMALTIVSGMLIFLFSLLFWFQKELWNYLIFSLLLAPIGMLLHPLFLNKIVNLGLRLAKKSQVKLDIAPIEVLKLLLFYILIWLVNCAAFYFLANSIYQTPISKFLSFSGIYTIAGVSGLLAIFAPAGLGVKEGMLTILLSLHIPTSIATIIALLNRIWFVLTEMVCVGLSILFAKGVKGRQNAM